MTTAGLADRELGIRGGKIIAMEPLGAGLQGTDDRSHSPTTRS